jgi:hypothetical protein
LVKKETGGRLPRPLPTGLNASMPELTLRADSARADPGSSTIVTFTSAPSRVASAILARLRLGDGNAGFVRVAVSNSTEPPTRLTRLAPPFAERYLPRCTEADPQAWRDHQVWTAEKYGRFDRDERCRRTGDRTAKADGWLTPFDAPIVLANGKQLVTLRDAIRQFGKTMPKRERNHPSVLLAATILTNAPRAATS